MASNFDCIGLRVTNATELEDLVFRLAGDASERLVTDIGEYAIWRSRTGAELWLHLGAAEEGVREIVGMTPFFDGRSNLLLDVDRVIKRPSDNEHEGAFHGRICASANDGTPLIFDAVDFAAHNTRSLPARWHIRLTGFARQMILRTDAERHRPALTLTDASADIESMVRVSGQIASCETLINEATGNSFCWLFIDGADASLDVVAPLEVLPDAIKLGAMVEADCVLFGRIMD